MVLVVYSPRTGLLSVNAIDEPTNAGRPAKGYFSADDPTTGELAWQMIAGVPEEIDVSRLEDELNKREYMDWLQGAVLAAAVVAIAAQLAVGSVALAQTPDPADVAAGMRIYRQKGDCQACHGWAADGSKMDSQMPDGANLRTTRLDRDMLILAIKCGRPGRSMPAFDRLAYSDGRCFGWTQADLKKRELTLPDPAATLQPREIEVLADFLLTKVVGQGPMDRAKCIEYWGSDVDVCSEFPK